MASHIGSDGLESSHVGSTPLTSTSRLGWRVDSHQHNIRLCDTLAYLGAEKEIGLASWQDSVLWLVVRVWKDFRICGPRRTWLSIERCLFCTITRDADDIFQAWFIDGRVTAVPASNASLIEVDHGDAEMRVVEGNHRCRWTAWEEG